VPRSGSATASASSGWGDSLSEVASEIEILSVRGLTTVQDAGRPGRMHEGVPPGGSLVPELAARANAAAGNADSAALLEIFGGVAVAPRGGSLVLATEEGLARAFAADEPFDVPPSRTLRARYLAPSGGLVVPEALGARGTLLVARLGGLDGRALRRGDRIPVGTPAPSPASLHETSRAWAPLDLSRPVRIVRGPDASDFPPEALDALLGGSFTLLATSDRTGARLAGPVLARTSSDLAPSAPMVRGAIQVPSSGQPIVLGPDHPTTGGYPVLAVVARVDLGRLFARGVGAKVDFTLITLDEARALALSPLETRP
jgi:5-oxoprolinase (ATP-hydrolysing) subunit C